MVLFAIKYALDRQVVRGPIKKARSTPALLLRIHPKGTEFARARDQSLRKTIDAYYSRSIAFRQGTMRIAWSWIGAGVFAERAIDWLERAVAQRTGPANGLSGTFLLASLHGHPRFEALLSRLQQPARATGSPAVE
jgi:hypothetical protein